MLHALVLAGSLVAPANEGPTPPNVLFVIADDLTAEALSVYGNTQVHTPNVERLAQRGVVFDRAFSNAPVCSVARTTLMTGVLAPRIGSQYHRKMQMAHLPRGLRMFPAYLRDSIPLALIVLDPQRVHPCCKPAVGRQLTPPSIAPFVDDQCAVHKEPDAVVGSGAESVLPLLKGQGARPLAHQLTEKTGGFAVGAAPGAPGSIY